MSGQTIRVLNGKLTVDLRPIQVRGTDGAQGLKGDTGADGSDATVTTGAVSAAGAAMLTGAAFTGNVRLNSGSHTSVTVNPPDGSTGSFVFEKSGVRRWDLTNPGNEPGRFEWWGFDASGNYVKTYMRIDQGGDYVRFYTDVEVVDAAFGAGWNGSTAVPTKNAVYDKITALEADLALLRSQTGN